MKVAMYVFNDCTTDARVLREAAALAGAGHTVTIVARRDHAGTPSREARDGFEIVRLPIPAGPHLIWLFLRYPARARRQAGSRMTGSFRRGPRGLPAALGSVGIGLAALLWSALRVPIDWVVGGLVRAAGRSPTPGADLVEWLARWRWGTLGWARDAARIVPDADVHHGHDLSGLPAAVRAVAAHPGSQAIYDSHEIFLESRTNALRPRWVRRRFAAIEQAWIRRTAAIVTVNDALAEELGRRYATPRIVAVRNCSPRWTPPDVPEDRIRRAAAIDEDAPVALYHGGFFAHRGLEQLAEAILEPGLEGVHAVYLGYGSERERLAQMAADQRYGGRLHVLGPVAPEEVVPWVAGADVEVMAIQPSTLNHRLSTPNKMFEALAAGTPVVASDFPEMRRILAEDPSGALGELCDPTDPASVAGAIRAVISHSSESSAALRARCLAAAHRRWNWETEAGALLGLYDDLGRAGAETPVEVP